MKVRNTKDTEKIPLDMTPMIDIVFQLLAFFVMTFKIVAPEGDFNIKMPLAAPSQGNPDIDLFPPIKISLSAGAGGKLASIRMGENSISSMPALRAQVSRMVGGDAGPDAAGNFEVELECDYNLRYEHVIEAITAVTGYREDGKVVKLIEKVKFAPPKKPG